MASSGSDTESDDECVETAPYISWERLCCQRKRECVLELKCERNRHKCERKKYYFVNQSW